MRLMRAGRAARDAAVLVVVGIVLFATFGWFDAYEFFAAYLKEYEVVQLDELLTALLIVGLLGFIFGYRRLRDLQDEVAHRSRAERDVSWIAAHDPLTRLPNRVGLKQEVERLRASDKVGQPHMAMVIDVQGFRYINDIYGNETSDEILVNIADRLREVFVGCFLFRLGGDQFYAAQEGSQTKDWEKLAKRAIKQISAPIQVNERHYEVSAYIGMARYPDDAANIKYLLRCALSAVSSAKRRVSASSV